MRYTSITIDLTIFDRLWETKEGFIKLIGRKVTWGSFLEQAALFLEAGSLLPSVKAERLSPYIYLANCPDCGAEEYPLRRRGRVAWKVKCSKCGIEYIALA